MTNNPTAPAEQLLLLAADFTRHNDALDRIQLTGSRPSIAVTHQSPSPRTWPIPRWAS